MRAAFPRLVLSVWLSAAHAVADTPRLGTPPAVSPPSGRPLQVRSPSASDSPSAPSLAATASAKPSTAPKTSLAPVTAPHLVIVENLNAEAKARQQDGKALFERGEWASAGAQFERAYAASSDARMLWNAALAEKGQKHPVKALNLVKRFAKERGPALTPQESKDADDLRKALEGSASKLNLTVSVRDAAVFVDDEPVGATPLTTPVLLDPGTKRIRVTKSGFKDALETETFASGSAVTLEIVLQPDVHQGRLHVKAAPSDTIWLDGKVVAQGQWEAPVPSGKHYVSVTAPGKRSYEAETTVDDAQMRELSVTLQADNAASGTGGTWLWVAGGAFLVASAVVGGYLLLKPTSTPDAPIDGSFGTIRLPLDAR